MRKELIIHSRVAKEIRDLPNETKAELGELLLELQCGMMLSLPVSRPMPVIAVGANEIRIGDRAGIYRVFYYLKSKRGILVFHMFNKKTQKTPEHEIKLGRIRLKEMLKDD